MTTYARLREVLDYDHETGAFTWLKTLSRRAIAGKIAGSLNKSTGYILICIDGERFRAHRLAWLYTVGVWPQEHLDHINGARDDNRWSNLREALGYQNAANARLAITNTSGLKGVSWHKAAQKWCVQIRHNGQRLYLGLFDRAEDAHATYMAKARELNGEFARAR